MSEAEVCKSFSEDKRKREIPSAPGAKAVLYQLSALSESRRPQGALCYHRGIFSV